MKTILTSIILTSSLMSSQAAISLVSQDDNAQGNTLTYGSVFFSSIAVQAGDVLVLTHANNKRDNGSNTITASTNTSESFSTIAAGNSGGQAGAWIFYSTITTAGNIDITFSTNNGSGNGSKSNAYYLLRAGAGEMISLADSDTAADVAGTSLGLTIDPSAVGGYAVMAAAVDSNTITGTPTGFTEDRNSVDKRNLWSNNNLGAGDLSPSVTVDAAESEAAAVAAFIATPVPEPSSSALLGLGGLALILRRRK